MESYTDIVLKIKTFNDDDVSKDYRTILICSCYLLCFEFNEFIKYEKIANKKLERQLKKPSDKKLLLDYIRSLNISDYSSFLYGILKYIENDKTIIKYHNLELSDDLSNLIIKLFELKEEDTILDLCSNNGLFLNNLLFNLKDELNLKVIGNEFNQDQCELSSLLLEMNNIPYEINNLNVIENYNKLPEFDKCLVFPPFGIKFDNKTYEKYIKYSNGLINQRTSGEWMFIFNALSSLNDDSKIICVIPDNILFKAHDSDIRKYLVNNNLIEGIISLPVDAFKGYSIKTSLLILSKNNEYFKVIDSEEVLNNKLVEDSLNEPNRLEEIYYKYKSDNVLKIKKEDIKSMDYNLTFKSLSNINLYQDESNTKELKEVSEILKGCNLTYTNFKDLVVDYNTNYKILNSGDIDDNGFIHYKDLKSIINGEKYSKYLARNGDIVITSKSTKTKVGYIELKDNENIIVASSMTILRVKEDVIDSLYLKMFLDSPKGRKLLDVIQMGNMVMTISPKALSLIQIPYIPLENQKKKSKMYKTWIELYELKKKELNTIEFILENFYDLSLDKEKI